MLSKGLVTSSVARTKPYLLTGWFPLREQFIYHVPKFPHMLEYITILLINYILGGSISYYTLHFITFVMGPIFGPRSGRYVLDLRYPI